MILTSKRLAAARLLTSERPFVCVDTFVDQQVVGFGEVSMAKPTQVLAFASLRFHGGH